ncbi:MAG: MBL fold metallo-hydrolase [Defluviitaleaceae bacterium]|nr:MBL fold metallo-hydrolase [Defluviitaleaceae bacterium]
MKLITFNKNATSQNAYLYYNEETKEGVLIDPGFNADEAGKYVENNNICVKGILLTHGHYDHITAVVDVNKKVKAEVCCHINEKNMLETPSLNLSTRTDCHVSITPDLLVNHGDMLTFGGAALEVIHTPGHTPGCVCYYDKDNAVIFTGDTLFKESVGRSDLPGGEHDVLMESIKAKLFTLPEGVAVYPGHGGSTSISHEVKLNPFVK